MVDLSFPPGIKEKLIAEGKASTHHLIPKSGWLSYRIEKAEDPADAVELFRLQYQHLTGKSVKEKWAKLSP